MSWKRALSRGAPAPNADRDRDRPRVAGIVLAAGAGRRFGGGKQLAVVDGEPLVARACRAACAVDVLTDVVVVVGSQAADVRSALPTGRQRVTTCGGWAEGIAASLRRGLEEVGPVDAALVLLADQPLVDASLIDHVLRRGLPGLGGSHDVARPFHDGIPGHPVLLGRVAIDRALQLQGDRGLGPILQRRRIRAISVAGLASTFDVDHPADVAAAEHALEHRRRADDARGRQAA